MYIYFICLNLKNQRLLKTCHILQGQYDTQFCSKTTKTRLANLKHMNGVRQVSSSVHNDLLSWLRLLVSFLSFLPEKKFSQLKSMFIVHTGWSDLAIICNFRKATHFCWSGIFLGGQFQKIGEFRHTRTHRMRGKVYIFRQSIFYV